MTNWSSITVVMITRNAAATLACSLRSIPKEATIIVADGDSTDNTVPIAHSFGARVVRQDQDPIAVVDGNFDVARNQAMGLVERDWLFILDGDEELSLALINEVSAIIEADQDHAAYDMPRSNLFWGKEGRLLGEDRQIRLLRQGRGGYGGRQLHSPIWIDGTVGRLDATLIHHNINNWEDVGRRFRRYLPVERRTRTPAATPLAALLLSCHMLRYYLFRQQAWRDGLRGVLVSSIFSLYHGLARWPERKK